MLWRRTSTRRTSTLCPRPCTGLSSPWPAQVLQTSKLGQKRQEDSLFQATEILRPKLLRGSLWPRYALSVESSASLCPYQLLWQTSTGRYSIFYQKSFLSVNLFNYDCLCMLFTALLHTSFILQFIIYMDVIYYNFLALLTFSKVVTGHNL